METRLLEYFVAVAGELSVTEAARRLYAAQSTVSAGLRSLETELGVQLLRRTTKTVELTAAGEELLIEARRILDAVERLHALASETASGQRGRLTLGTFTGQDLVHDLPSALRAFRITHPQVDLRLVSSQRGSTGYAEDLIRGQARRGVLRPDPTARTRCRRAPRGPLRRARRTQSHPLATEPTVSLARSHRTVDRFAGWIWQPHRAGTRPRQHRLRRQVVAEIADVLAIPGYVATGMGVAVVPDIIDPSGCAKLTLAEPIAPWTVNLATRPNASDRPTVAALIDALRSHTRQQHRQRLRAQEFRRRRSRVR